MEWKNETSITKFILPGSRNLNETQILLFALFLVIYILTMAGNFLIVVLVVADQQLHTPMYFFLGNLSFWETYIWYTTACATKAIGVMFGKSQTISFTGCILQLYFIFSLGSTECLILAVMAYDRYLAICHPLHYSSLMNSTFSAQLALISWLCGFLVISVLASLISRLSFCGPNIIHHFFCDINSWIALSCTDTRLIELATFIISINVLLGSCAITLISYIYIISTICRIPSAQSHQKAFSTCSAHFTVVTILYGSTIFLYVKPSAQNSLDLNKIVNIFSAIVNPLLNPFIYTLRNKEVKRALEKVISGM
uniref:Olfactory receptor n=1 Tax=Gopherus evgoodei TaxID=1825980 RepID=A0A8C4WQ14_9SAUR